MTTDQSKASTLPKGRLSLSDVLCRDEAVVTRKVAGETVLVPVRSNVGDLDHVYTIPVVGSFVWEEIDGEKSLEAIVSDVVGEFDVTRVVAENDILEFAADLIGTGLARLVESAR